MEVDRDGAEGECQVASDGGVEVLLPKSSARFPFLFLWLGTAEQLALKPWWALVPQNPKDLGALGRDLPHIPPATPPRSTRRRSFAMFLPLLTCLPAYPRWPGMALVGVAWP